MRAGYNCPICIYNTYLGNLAKIGGLSDGQKDDAVAWFFKNLGKQDIYADTPVHLGRAQLDHLKELSGGADLMGDIKKEHNAMVLGIRDAVWEEINSSDNPWNSLIRYTIAGNVLDPMGNPDIDVKTTLDEAASATLVIDDSAELERRIREAKSIIYLTDNAGEVIIDQLFIRYILENGMTTPDRFKLVVRGDIAINDALREDAITAGIDKLVEVKDTGDGSWGIIFENSSPEFMDLYNNADLIIAKGMGNYETLDFVKDRTICFLLMAKCPPVAASIGVERGSFVCMINSAH